MPTLSDPELAPAGEHLLILTSLVRSGAGLPWRDEKERVTARMLRMAERRVPGLGRHLRFVETGTPRTMERYTRNSEGAAYGWELSPSRVGPGRPGNRTPLAGLHLVGHWTQPGGGIYGVVSSGIQTAHTALGVDRNSKLWSGLRVGR